MLDVLFEKALTWTVRNSNSRGLPVLVRDIAWSRSNFLFNSSQTPTGGDFEFRACPSHHFPQPCVSG